MDTKQASLWKGLKRLWSKWKGKGEYKGPSPTEDQIVSSFAREFVKESVWPQANLFLKQVVLEANKAGLPHDYLPYVFWLLVEQRKEWPDMHPNAAGALRLLRDLTVSLAIMPNYRPALQIPPVEYEAAVDMTLKGVGFWAYKNFKLNLLKAYRASLKRWAKPMALAIEGTLPPDRAGTYLHILFETQLKQLPGQFLDGLFLNRIIFGLFR